MAFSAPRAALLALALLLAAAAPAAAAGRRGLLEKGDKEDKCIPCSSCATCMSYTSDLVAGTKDVRVSVAGCKSGEAISWLACRGTNVAGGACTIVNTDVASPCTNVESSMNKCNGARVATFTVPIAATKLTLQLHDGLFIGDNTCTEVGLDCAGGFGGNAVCAAQGGGTNACQVELDVSTCTEAAEPPNTGCTVDSECQDLDSVCSLGKCNAGTCEATPKPSDTPCRTATTSCDVTEYCTGSSLMCPDDKFEAQGTLCRAAVTAADGTTCDVAETCTGTSPECPADAAATSGTTCRAANGDCDVAETCNGTSTACPVDAFKPATFTCRDSAGVCDEAEMCPGDGPGCPANGFKPATFVCRNATGPCDKDDVCPGDGEECTADTLQPEGHVCRPTEGNACDVEEKCTGDKKACPVDQVKNQGYSIKCATTIYVCAVDPALPRQGNGNAYNLGGCTLGTASSKEPLPAIRPLDWPACMNQCINTPCNNLRGLSNMVFFDCLNNAGTADWKCNSKIDVSASTKLPHCPQNTISGWKPVPIDA
ncbi:MAG: hypothetical protein J3K34DRAFT_444528 [Monoraphidium minutum]|nr:MAG: hypothetical protein J3K34DRAFT_444528 [Monoraphidium minutum]